MVNENKKWNLRREISYGQILTIITIALAALVFTIRLEGRVNLVEVTSTMATDNNRTAVINVNDRVTRQYSEIIGRLERISNKLDMKADK